MMQSRCVQGVTVRLTNTALDHIAEEHPELMGQEALIMDVLTRPDLVVKGRSGEFSAIRKLASGRRLVVVYRLQVQDGFVITSFYIRTARYYLRREHVWP